jgi:hypothetical protein
MTTVTAIWAALGPLVGVLIGAYIANLNQRRQWLAGCRKEEYSELISVLTKSLMTYITLQAFLVSKGPGATRAEWWGPEEQRSEYAALSSVGETARNRLFIAHTVKSLHIVERWHTATRAVESGGSLDEFSASVGKLLDEIRDAALTDLG